MFVLIAHRPQVCNIAKVHWIEILISPLKVHISFQFMSLYACQGIRPTLKAVISGQVKYHHNQTWGEVKPNL